MNLADVAVARRADVAIDGITSAATAWQRQNRRPRALSARDALVALQFETLFVSVAALNLANGVDLTNDDRERLMQAHRRIDVIANEAVG